jgi:protein-tyrosine phosphatase
MGKSRSVAVILVYLMKYKALSIGDAVALVKAKRHIIKPNPSYMKQL